MASSSTTTISTTISSGIGSLFSYRLPIHPQKLFLSPNSNPRSNRVVAVRADTSGGGGSNINKNINKTSTAEQKWVTKGLITESLPNGMFWVRLENGDVVLGYISGKIRRNSIRMLAGDKVKIEVSRYDSTRGRIVYRIGNKDN